MADWAKTLGAPTTVLWVVAGMWLVLIVGTAIRLIALRGADSEKRARRIQSLVSWWVLAVVFAAVVLIGRGALIAFFALASFLGLREFFALTTSQRWPRGLRELAFVAIGLNYLWIYLQRLEMFWIFIPVCVFLLLPAQ